MRETERGKREKLVKCNQSSQKKTGKRKEEQNS